MVPTSTKVLIIGGGPAGLATAITLARQNIDAILFERYDLLINLLKQKISSPSIPHWGVYADISFVHV
jgi:NADPH-dependent glutamate synthase beta subunit-like oxidoreductase